MRVGIVFAIVRLSVRLPGCFPGGLKNPVFHQPFWGRCRQNRFTIRSSRNTLCSKAIYSRRVKIASTEPYCAFVRSTGWTEMKELYAFYGEAFRIALQAIWSHKLRAFLTLIGVIIGVASVVVVGAAISGLNTYVVDRVSRVLG